MATTSVTGADLTNLRTGSQYIDSLALHITPLTSIQTATVTSIPTFSPFAQVGVSWDGSYSSVSTGQLVRIMNGETHRAWAVVRKAPASSVLYISTTPLGSGGFANSIQSPIQVGDTVTVYTHRPLWGLYSRISNREFYKSWDIPYTDQNSQPPPVANAGAWQVAQINEGDSATFTLPRKGVNSSFNFGSATTSSRLWTLPSGVNLVAGYTTSDAVIEVTASAGYHLVSYTHTDSNGKAHTAYTWLFVSDGATGASLSERYAVSIESDTQTADGRTLSVNITGENLNEVLYPGAGICLKEWGIYNGNTLTDGIAIDTFIGYVAELSITHDGNIGTASLLVESPYIYASRIQQPAQVIEETISPNRWSEATSVLTNPHGLLYYAIKWHSPTLLDMHDFDAPFTTPRRKSAQWKQGSLQSAMQTVAEYIAGHVGSASDGTTVMRDNPMYMDNTDRNALVSVITWLAQDIQAPIEIIRSFMQSLNEARTGAFAYDGTSVKAWLAGKFWNQGAGTTTLPNFTVTSSEGLSRVLEIVGHFYAEQSRDILEIPITLTRNQDIIDPAYMLWNTLTIGSEFDTYGEGFNAKRTICTRVEREWEYTPHGWLKRIQLGLQPETFGQPGEEIPIANAKTYQLNGYSFSFPVLFTPSQNDSAFGGVSIMLLCTTEGKLAITYNYLSDNPLWADVTPYVNNEAVNDFSLDYNSAYFANGNNPSFALGLYVVTTDDTGLNVWYFPDILNSTSATIIETAEMNDSSNTTSARIEVSETTPTLAVVAWHDQTGVEFIRTTNGGSSWSSKANVGDVVTDTTNDNAQLGLDIDGVKQLISAPNSSGEYGLYYASTAGGSFSRLGNTEISTSPLPMVKIIPSEDDSYTTVNGVSSPDYEITFDAGGYTNYNIRKLGLFSQPASSGGNPDLCARDNGTDDGTNSTSYLTLRIDFSPTIDLYAISFDYYCSYSGDPAPTIFRATLFNDEGISDIGDTLTLENDGAWHTVSIDVSDAPPTGVSFISLQIGWATTTDQTTSASYDYRFDNVQVWANTPVAPGLYKVTDFDGTDSWADVSPDTEESATLPHALAIDLIDSDVVNIYVNNSDKWYRSINGASSWSTVETDTDANTFYTSGNSRVVAGTSSMQLALDGSTLNNKTGNLALVVGANKAIKRIQPL